MRVLSEQEVKDGDFMPTSKERAKLLKVTLEYSNERRVAFKVIDPETGSEHIVYYKKVKKPPLDWACDCEWYTTKTIHNGKYCAHILAVHLHQQA